MSKQTQFYIFLGVVLVIVFWKDISTWFTSPITQTFPGQTTGTVPGGTAKDNNPQPSPHPLPAQPTYGL